MARYGNILCLFGAGEAEMQTVAAILDQHGVINRRVENTFFIETFSKENTKSVVQALLALQLVFTFFHNGISDRSALFSKGLTENDATEINRILLE